MSLSPEVRAVLEQRIEALRGAREGLDKLIDAAIEDRSLRSGLAAVMGDRWVSILVSAETAAADEAWRIEFELRHEAGADEPKGGES
jgi:hypothetical protein